MKWFGKVGATSFDGATWHSYNDENGLVNNDVRAIAVDQDNVKWFGTVSGISSFDGTTWTTYTDAMGYILKYNTYAIAVDKNNVKWFGQYMRGVISFDDSEWTTYTTENGLADKSVYAVAVDKNNVKWFGTKGKGVSSFDGTVWKTYTTEDGLASNSITGITVDADNVKWFCGEEGSVTAFNGVDWKRYTESDGLANNTVLSIAVDADNVKWFATYTGISSFDGQFVLVENEEEAPSALDIRGNYPNPFNPTTTIEFSIAEPSVVTLDVFNVSAQKVATLVNGRLTIGKHTAVFDGSHCASGLYFYRITSQGMSETGKMMLVK